MVSPLSSAWERVRVRGEVPLKWKSMENISRFSPFRKREIKRDFPKVSPFESLKDEILLTAIKMYVLESFS
jgi:hypothetical protein